MNEQKRSGQGRRGVEQAETRRAQTGVDTMDENEAAIRKTILDLMLELSQPDYRSDPHKERELGELYKQLPGGRAEFIID